MVCAIGFGGDEALYASETMRRFVGIDLRREAMPGETTVLTFQHLLERRLPKQLFAEVPQHLVDCRMTLSPGRFIGDGAETRWA